MPTKPEIQYEDFTRLDLRIATIASAEVHPNADRLLKLQVDLGDHQRQICAGIRAYYDPADLVGRQVLVVVNLAPRTIRGEESNGMLLAASVRHGEEDQVLDVVVLSPSKSVPNGASVS